VTYVLCIFILSIGDKLNPSLPGTEKIALILLVITCKKTTKKFQFPFSLLSLITTNDLVMASSRHDKLLLTGSKKRI
jgi:hypothetical protein